jgi:hypothetical protein
MQLITSENRELRCNEQKEQERLQENTEVQTIRSQGEQRAPKQETSTHLTSLPTVMLAMTFLTASRFSPFLDELSACFSSKSSPVNVKEGFLKMQLVEYKRSKPRDHDKKSRQTLLGASEVLSVSHVYVQRSTM